MRSGFNKRMGGKALTTVSAVLLFCLFVLGPGNVIAADDERSALQDKLESGADLSPRAQKVLFSCRTRQDDGNYTDAARMMQEWISDHPNQPHHLLHFNLAISQLGLEQFTEAGDNFEQAVALEPQFARGWLRLGEAAYEQQNYARAAEAFLRGHDLMCDPRPEIRYYSAVAWLLAKEPDKALIGLNDLLGDHADMATLDWYQALVAAASEAGQYDEASPWVDKCLMDNESEPRAWYLAYQFATAREDYRQAAVWLTVVGHLRPLTRNEFLLLGNLYSGVGIPLQAARNYQKALEFPETQPNQNDYLRLASAWMAAYQMDEARVVLDRGIAAGATVKLLALLGDLNYTEKNYTDARLAFSRCVEMDPEYGRGWLMSGYCCLELEENQKARTCLQQACDFPTQRTIAEELLRRIAP